MPTNLEKEYRIFKEDYLVDGVENHFDLVLLAAFRLSELRAGEPVTIRDSKLPIEFLCLEEIRRGTIDLAELRARMVRSRYVSSVSSKEELRDSVESDRELRIAMNRIKAKINSSPSQNQKSLDQKNMEEQLRSTPLISDGA